MILTDYYRFEKLPNQRSKLRIDCTASTGSYDPLETLRNKDGDLFLYIGDNTHTKAGRERKADLVLSRTTHISSVYNPDLNFPYWYGDMKGTTDAFFICSSKHRVYKWWNTGRGGYRIVCSTRPKEQQEPALQHTF